MYKFAASMLLTFFVAANAMAAGGVADKKGTIHVGVKVGPSDVTGSPVGVGVYGGYTLFGPNTFNQNEFLSKLSFAVEGEYVNLGSTTTWGVTYSAYTMGAVAAATYPLNEQFSVIAKAGVASVTSEITGCGWWCNASSTSIGAHAGAAGQFNLTPQIALRAGYDSYPKHSMMSFSGVFKF
ncbi:MAG TPA: outer membrane beta-barrel protein [Gallionella sp.]